MRAFFSSKIEVETAEETAAHFAETRQYKPKPNQEPPRASIIFFQPPTRHAHNANTAMPTLTDEDVEAYQELQARIAKEQEESYRKLYPGWAAEKERRYGPSTGVAQSQN